MSIEQRQTEIKVGAGLEEQGLNRELVDRLKKYSTPATVVLLIIVSFYVGRLKWNEYVDHKLGLAFQEFEQAEQAGSPEALIATAREHAGQAAVSILAHLAAADLYLASARNGLRIGASPGTTATEDRLTDAQRLEHLMLANAEYQAALDGALARSGSVVTALGARFGLAAVAESTGFFDPARDGTETAKTQYQAIIALADASGFSEESKRAAMRLESLESIKSTPRLISDSEVFKPAPPVVPDPAGGTPAPISIDPTTSPTEPAVPAPEEPAPATTDPSPAPPESPDATPATPEPAPDPAPATPEPVPPKP